MKTFQFLPPNPTHDDQSTIARILLHSDAAGRGVFAHIQENEARQVSCTCGRFKAEGFCDHVNAFYGQGVFMVAGHNEPLVESVTTYGVQPVELADVAGMGW